MSVRFSTTSVVPGATDCTIRLLSDLGYQPVVVDISEFQKLEGCVTCLSVRLRSVPPTTSNERYQR